MISGRLKSILCKWYFIYNFREAAGSNNNDYISKEEVISFMINNKLIAKNVVDTILKENNGVC